MSGIFTSRAHITPDASYIKSHAITPPLYGNTFEGGTDGTTLTAANSGGASGDAFSGRLTDPGVTIQYTAASTIRPASLMSAAIVYVADSGGYFYYNISPSSTTSRVVVRAYCYVGDPAGPGQSGDIFLTIRGSSGTQIAGLGTTTNGYFAAYSAIGIAEPLILLPTNAWYRFDLAVTVGTTTSNGRVEYSLYSLDDHVSILSGDSGPTTNAGTDPPASVRFGRSGNTNNFARTYCFDDVGVAVDVPSGFLAPSA